MKEDNVAAYCFFGAQTVLGQLKAYEEHSQAALEGIGPEDVHQTRVSSRRLLSLFALFPECFPGKRRKRLVKEIRKAAKALSGARDLDVQAARVESYLKGAPGKPPDNGPSMLLEDMRKEREHARKEASEAIIEINEKGVIEEIGRICEKTVEKNNGEQVRAVSYAPAGMRISRMLEDMLSYEPSVSKESDIEAHHRMRIAAKRLRYALETYAGLCGNESCPDASSIKHLREVVEISEYVSLLKKLQEVLGEMHDYDVLTERLDECAKAGADNKKERKAAEKSLAPFRQYLKEGRAAEYKRFVSCWNEAAEKKTFESLKEILYPASAQTKKNSGSLRHTRQHSCAESGHGRRKEKRRRILPERRRPDRIRRVPGRGDRRALKCSVPEHLRELRPKGARPEIERKKEGGR